MGSIALMVLVSRCLRSDILELTKSSQVITLPTKPYYVGVHVISARSESNTSNIKHKGSRISNISLNSICQLPPSHVSLFKTLYCVQLLKIRHRLNWRHQKKLEPKVLDAAELSSEAAMELSTTHWGFTMASQLTIPDFDNM
jgi:hypothetical protein